MCISLRRTLKEELKNIQMKSKQILLKQEKKQKNLKKTLKRVQVRRTCDQSAFVLSVLFSWKQVNTHNVRETGGGKKRRGRLRERLRCHHWLPPETFPISEGADRSSGGGGSSSGSELPTDPAGEDGGNEEEERWAGASSTDGQRCPFLAGIVWSHLQKLYLNPYDRWCLHFLCLSSLSTGMALSAAPLWKRPSSSSRWHLSGSTPPLWVHKECCWWAREATKGILWPKVHLNLSKWYVSLLTCGALVIKIEYNDILAFIYHLFNIADTGEQQGSGGETEKDDMQRRCEASTSQSHGLYLHWLG